MLELFLSACGAGMCVALMMLILKEFHHFIAARIFAALIFGAFVFLCHNWLPEHLSAYAYMIESATPAFFWMSCRLIFQEGSALPRLGLFIAFYSFTLPVIKHITLLYLGVIPDWLEFIGRELTQYCEYILVIMGIFALLTGQGDDLVESRRHLRWAIMGASGLSLGWAVFSFNLQLGSDISRILAVDISILIVIWSLFKGQQDIWGQSNSVDGALLADVGLLPQAGLDKRASGKRQAEMLDDLAGNQELRAVEGKKLDDIAQRLNQPQGLSEIESEALINVKEMMADGFYRRENLTLKDLAVALNIPEYKIRAIINQQLGYRNFNEFINEYRIKEAAQRLLTEPETPISNIALDVGYRTLSSFNRAFRKQKDTTPTAFREEA